MMKRIAKLTMILALVAFAQAITLTYENTLTGTWRATVTQEAGAQEAAIAGTITVNLFDSFTHPGVIGEWTTEEGGGGGMVAGAFNEAGDYVAEFSSAGCFYTVTLRWVEGEADRLAGTWVSFDCPDGDEQRGTIEMERIEE